VLLVLLKVVGDRQEENQERTVRTWCTHKSSLMPVEGSECFGLLPKQIVPIYEEEGGVLCVTNCLL
jgi:hypothetical protein